MAGVQNEAKQNEPEQKEPDWQNEAKQNKAKQNEAERQNKGDYPALDFPFGREHDPPVRTGEGHG